MIVAVIALVVATTGGAVAGALITGAGIKNSSVTGLDIKNNSLTGADVKNGSLGIGELTSVAVRSLRTGQPGPQGPPGPPGLTTGAAGGFHGDGGAVGATWDGTTAQNVVNVALPAGSFVLFGKVHARNDAGTLGVQVQILCTLTLGSTFVDQTPSIGLDLGDKETLVVSGRGSLAAPAMASITCSSGQAGIGTYVDRQIEAVQVGALP